MNKVILVGRLTADAEVRYTSDNLAIASFTVACNRIKDGTDFIRCKAFGKTAELIEKYFHKGKEIGIEGSIRTGSYKKEDGTTVYTTEVNVDRVEFVGSKSAGTDTSEPSAPVAEGFEMMDDDIPF